MRRILTVSVWGLLARDGVLVPGAARSRLCSVGLARLGTLPPAYPRMGNMIVCRTGTAAACALHGLSMLLGRGLLSGGRHLAVLLVRHAVAHKRSRRVVLAIEFAFALQLVTRAGHRSAWCRRAVAGLTAHGAMRWFV